MILHGRLASCRRQRLYRLYVTNIRSWSIQRIDYFSRHFDLCGWYDVIALITMAHSSMICQIRRRHQE